MKDFCKKHTVIFTLGIIFIALFSNLMTGFLQSFFPEYQVMYYLVEAILKFSISAGLIFLMFKWGYTKKTSRKNIALGFLLGAILFLFMAPNLVPFLFVNPILFDAQWGTIIGLFLATLSIGFMEETAMRGTLLPFLCEKWKDKKHSYLKAALLSSVLFGCMHYTWSVRHLVTNGNLPLDEFLGNSYQVFYCICFGLFTAGVALYTRNIIGLVLWHGLCDFVALIKYVILPLASIEYYDRQGLFTLEYVLYKLGITQGSWLWALLIDSMINLLLVIVGLILIFKAEKKYIKSN